MTVSSRITTYLVAGAIAAALLFYGFGQLSGILGARDAAITQASRAQLALHGALVRQRAHLQSVERAKAAEAVARAGVADSLRAALAAGRRVDTITVLRQIAAADSGAWRSCRVSLLACEQRADNAEAEAGSLHRRLTAQLAVHDRRCGLFGGVGVSAGLKIGTGLTIGVGCRLWP